MGISCRQFRFRRECLVIRLSAAEIATAPLGPRNDKSGSIAPLNSCHQYCQPAWRPERRYRRNWCIPFYRQPLRIGSIAPGAACRSPTTLHRSAKGPDVQSGPSLLLFHFHSAQDIDGAHAHAEVPALGIGVKIQVDLIALDAAADVLGHAVAIDILAVV